MRTREEIELQAIHSGTGDCQYDERGKVKGFTTYTGLRTEGLLSIVLEVALDIRDLLLKED